MRDHNYYTTLRLTNENGEIVDFHYTPGTARYAVTRTFPDDTFDPWCNWVTSLLHAHENCVQNLACYAEMVTLVGSLTLQGWVVFERPVRGASHLDGVAYAPA
jgi:hypothetical protein